MQRRRVAVVDAAGAHAVVAQLRPQWQVRALEFLAGGYSNSNYRVDTAAHGSYVLRLPHRGDSPFGINRTREYQLLHWAVANSLTLAPEYFDRTTGITISRFVGAGALGDLPRERWPAPAELGAVLRRLHAAAPPDLRADPNRATAASAALVPQLVDWSARCEALGRPLDSELLVNLASWQPADPEPDRVCHRDLNPWNFLAADGRLLLVDWELAGVGDRRFDLANLILLFEYPDPEAHAFVAEASAGTVALAQLKPWLWLVRVREYLWARLALASGNRRGEIVEQHVQRGAELGLTGRNLEA